MKKIITLIILFIAFIHVSAQYNSIHGFAVQTIDGEQINLSQYYGKKLMVVNTASYCGYTPQFTDLEKLYTDYKQYNFEIIGFPCNDFGSQDPKADSSIKNFCTSNYNVTFQMMSKIATVSADTAPVYKWLQRKNLNGVKDAHVTWNFNKFLIDEAGHWVAYYDSPVLPMDTRITNWIKKPSVLTGISSSLNMNDFIQVNDPSTSSFDLIAKTTTPQVYNFTVYSAEGKLISTIYSGMVNDAQRISYNYSSLNSGFYFIKIESEGIQKVIKLVVIK